jgi:hypothetical protein
MHICSVIGVAYRGIELSQVILLFGNVRCEPVEEQDQIG